MKDRLRSELSLGCMKLKDAMIVFPIAWAIFFGGAYLVHRLNVSRINSRPHATATIVDAWTEYRGGSKPYAVTIGRIKFERISSGKAINCEISHHIGYPTDNLQIGDTIDVVFIGVVIELLRKGWMW
ncbi:hypothetical protein [Phyllobacterium zundukense]|nr:hypothetical protein [Phyllobacterium zundukense]